MPCQDNTFEGCGNSLYCVKKIKGQPLECPIDEIDFLSNPEKLQNFFVLKNFTEDLWIQFHTMNSHNDAFAFFEISVGGNPCLNKFRTKKTTYITKATLAE